MVKCTACGKFLSSAGAATCAFCPCKYHRACVGINDGVTIPLEWTCPECSIIKKSRGDNTSTPVKGIMLIQPDQETTPAPSPSEETELRVMRRELAEYMVEFREFRREFRSTLVNINARVDGIEQRLEAVERKDAVLTADSSKVESLEEAVVTLKQELNDRDQDMLLSDLDIGHIPEEKGENVLHTVTVIAMKLGVKLEGRDVVFAERVGAIEAAAGTSAAGGGGAEPRPRRVVARLARRALRDELLRAARVRHGFTSADAGLTSPPRRLYVNERLTRVNRLLFYRVREECRKHQWKYSWTKRGRIYARQGDDKQVYPIRSDVDISRVFNTKAV